MGVWITCMYIAWTVQQVIWNIIIFTLYYFIFPPMLLNWSLKIKRELPWWGPDWGLRNLQDGGKQQKVIRMGLEGGTSSRYCSKQQWQLIIDRPDADSESYQSRCGLSPMIQRFCSSERRPSWKRWIWQDRQEDKSPFERERQRIMNEEEVFKRLKQARSGV